MLHTFETPTPPRLDLQVPAGAIQIDAVEGATATEVTLDGPQELLDDVVVEQRGETVRVHVRDRKELFGFRSSEALVRISCPAGSGATVRTKSADLTTRGLLATLDAATASGDLLVDRVAGTAALRSASGDLSLVEAGGDATIQTASGDIEAGRVGGSLRAHLVSGDLRVRDAAGPVSAETVSGDVRLEAVRQGSVRVQSVSGDVEVGVRRGCRVHVDASTLSGDTRSELDLDGVPVEGDGPLVELRVKTVSGDVAVVRASSSQEVQLS